jgi:hypothetical protein
MASATPLLAVEGLTQLETRHPSWNLKQGGGRVLTGVTKITKQNVAQFKHASRGPAGVGPREMRALARRNLAADLSAALVLAGGCDG